MTDSSYYTGYVWRPDRRRHPRMKKDIMMSIERLDGHDHVGHVQDLSLGGVRFQSVGPKLPLEETVRVLFSMGEDTFSIFGRTVRIRRLDAFSQEVSLAFTRMPPERLEALRRHLTSP